MCAINGFTWRDEALCERMNSVTFHRGPDGTGVFSNGTITLGHNRLRIIDLSDRAAQPMRSTDRTLVITFNGEIYNYRELRKELTGSYVFGTESDTEVILAGYKKWGRDVVKRLNGIFAFAVWDTQKRELFLARDHAGVKPLYYALHEGNLIFSSEVKGILEHPLPRRLNRTAFEHYMRVLYVPEPLTLIEGIQKLPPASLLTFNEGKIAIQSYWSPEDSLSSLSYDEAKLALTSKIDEAVSRELVSDRPLGLFLSGGIDSSVVLDSMAKAGGAVKTYSVGFDLREDEEREKFNADFLLARKTAAHYGSDHHEFMISPREALELFPRVIVHLDDPVSNPTAIAQFFLAREAGQSTVVVLSGDGGDELFGGYERYRLSLLSSYYRTLPRIMRMPLTHFEKFRKLNTLSGVDRFALFMFQKESELSRVLKPEFLTDRTRQFFCDGYFTTATASFEELFMDVDRHTWLVDESLARTDRMTAAHGLEGRVPLLDKEVIEFARTLQRSYKVTPFATKRILKDAFRKRLPAHLYHNPKRGWFSPAAKWLRYKAFSNFASEVLSESYYDARDTLLDYAGISVMLKDHREKRGYHLTTLWALLTFQLWARHHNIEV